MISYLFDERLVVILISSGACRLGTNPAACFLFVLQMLPAGDAVDVVLVLLVWIQLSSIYFMMWKPLILVNSYLPASRVIVPIVDNPEQVPLSRTASSPTVRLWPVIGRS